TPRSTLAQRIADAVEALRDAPPPRSITLDVAGVQIAVTLRGDAVHVGLLGGAQPPLGWQSEMADALASRGFTLADDETGGQARRDGGEDTPEQQPRPARTPRPTPTTRGWRL